MSTEDAQPDEFGLHHCPRCTDAVVDLEEHLEQCDEPEGNDPIAEARRLVAEDEQRKTDDCLAEIEAVLAKYGRKLVITQPQITIVPQ